MNQQQSLNNGDISVNYDGVKQNKGKKWLTKYISLIAQGLRPNWLVNYK